jgi:hypothetical protein
MRFGVTGAIASLVVVAGVVAAPAAGAAPSSRADEVVAHWTTERLAAAQPRDLVVDQRGLGYDRDADGRLTPHGHGRAATIPAPTVVPSSGRSQPAPTPVAKPTGDTSAPTITNMDPAGGTIGTSYTFSATVTDPSGVRSVSFVITDPNRRNSTFTPTANGSTYSVALQGFTPGTWSWTVKATDTRSNVATSSRVTFTVASAPGGNSTVVANSAWTGGAVEKAAGRIYFEMPDTTAASGWAGYVCSGTVVQEPATDRSIILTAAHCVYDDVAKVFARNVLFIPDQVASGTRTDTNCANDRYGCWAPSYGVVDTDWTTRTFPDNIPWDYAYYVVPTTGAHTAGTEAADESLETAVGGLPIDFATPDVNVANSSIDRTTALGYSYSQDPNFMYCAEDMTTSGTANWFLPHCGLSGGASGGPWIQPFDTATGSGQIISVNSWGYSNGSPGMAGPKLSGSSASALFGGAQSGPLTTTGGSALDVS